MKNPYSPRAHNIYYVSEIVRAYNQEKAQGNLDIYISGNNKNNKPLSLPLVHLFTSLQILQVLNGIHRPTDEEMNEKKMNLAIPAGYESNYILI